MEYAAQITTRLPADLEAITHIYIYANTIIIYLNENFNSFFNIFNYFLIVLHNFDLKYWITNVKKAPTAQYYL